jgi:hypothetical protein
MSLLWGLACGGLLFGLVRVSWELWWLYAEEYRVAAICLAVELGFMAGIEAGVLGHRLMALTHAW